jgi:hypothetical protein
MRSNALFRKRPFHNLDAAFAAHKLLSANGFYAHSKFAGGIEYGRAFRYPAAPAGGLKNYCVIHVVSNLLCKDFYPPSVQAGGRYP